MAARINWRINTPDGDFIERSVLQVGWQTCIVSSGAVCGACHRAGREQGYYADHSWAWGQWQ
jgi:hypothetical protein